MEINLKFYAYFVSLSLALFFSPLSMGKQVNDLYSTEVLIPNQSRLAMEQGLRDALRKVVVKLTGNSKLASANELVEALNNLDDYIEVWGYSDALETTLNKPEKISLKVSFSPTAMERFLRVQKFPLLPSNRPLVLIWILSDDAELGRQFVNIQTQPGIVNLVKNMLDQRGIPFVSPNYDLEDVLSLPIQNAWRMDAEIIAEASQRYESDVWLMLRFYKTSTGEIRGAWLYQVADVRKLGDYRSASISNFLDVSINKIIDGVADHYVFIPQTAENKVMLIIDGINSYSQYRELIINLERLELVKNIQTSEVYETRVEIVVNVEDEAHRLYKSLLRSGKFLPVVAEQSFELGEIALRWVKK